MVLIWFMLLSVDVVGLPACWVVAEAPAIVDPLDVDEDSPLSKFNGGITNHKFELINDISKSLKIF